MSRAFDATCVGSVVKIEGKPVTATVLSQGAKSSQGMAVMTSEKIHYVASNAEDIKDLITNLESIISQIVLALTGLDAVTLTPGSNAASIALVTTLKAQITAQKTNLK